MPTRTFGARRCAPKAIFALTAALAGSLANAQQVSSVTVTPHALYGGATSNGVVKLSSAAPPGGFVVNLACANVAAWLPQTSVTVPSGSFTAPFTVTTTPVATDVSGNVLASGGGKTVHAALIVKSPRIKVLVVNQPSVVGSLNAGGKVALTSKAPAGGLTVPLSSGAAFATPDASAFVPGGQTQAPFTIKTSSVSINSVATIWGQYGGATASAPLTVLPPSLVSVRLKPPVVVAGGMTNGTVSLDVLAPPAGLSVPISANTTDLVVPTSAFVQGGTKTGTFIVQANATAKPNFVTVSAGTGAASFSTSLKIFTDPWPQSRGDRRNTGIGAGNGGSGVFQWAFQTMGEVATTPAIGRDGTVYFGSVDCFVYAVKPNGTVKWKLQLPDWVESSPALAADGTVVVGCFDGNMYGIDSAGNYKWSVATGSPITGSPSIALDGSIYFGSDNGFVYALKPNGTAKWVYDTGDFVWCSPAIADDGTIYIGSRKGFLYALTPSGSLKWKYALSGLGDATPSIGADGTIYVGSGFQGINRFYAINPDGSTKWTFDTGGWVQSSAAIGFDGVIYIGCNDGNLYALNPDGTQKWAYFMDSIVFAAPTLATNGTIYVGGNDGAMVCLNANGTLKWKSMAGFYIVASAALGLDGSVYFASGDGKVYKFK